MSDVKVFETQGQIAPEGVVFNNKTADQLRGNTPIEVYDRKNRRCQLAGTVTEAYQYGGMTILAVWDADEPLAWAMVLNVDGSVTHYDEVYDLLVVPDFVPEQFTMTEITEELLEDRSRQSYTILVEPLKKFADSEGEVFAQERAILHLLKKTLTYDEPVITGEKLKEALAGNFDPAPFADVWRGFCFYAQNLIGHGVIKVINKETK